MYSRVNVVIFGSAELYVYVAKVISNVMLY